MYQILCRYEYYGSAGIVWTKWHTYCDNIKTKKDAEEKLNSIPKDAPKTKLKHEYKIEKKDE